MYLNVNCVVVAGSVSETPVLRYTGSNVPVTNFTIKTIKTRKNFKTGEIVKEKKTHKIVCWRGNAIKATKLIKENDNAIVVGELNYIKSQTTNGEHIVTPEIKAMSIDSCKSVSSISAAIEKMEEINYDE